MTAGRPPKYNNAKELQDKIESYFDGGYRTKLITNKSGEVIEIPKITISDLVLYLGFCDRSSFYDLEKQEEFSYTIKRARTFIEREYEECLNTPGLNVAGSIFALKNFGWVDKQDIDVKTDGEKINTPDETLRRFAFMLRNRTENGDTEDKG